MLISNKLIFVHYPKTGGTSVRKYLAQQFPDSYLPVADTQLSEDQKAWLMHQGLGVCYKYAAQQGLNPSAIPTLVCIRNPYALMLSGYLYLTQNFKDQIDDLESSFHLYLTNMMQRVPDEVMRGRANAPFGPYTPYLSDGMRLLPNVTIARTETLAADVKKFVRNIGAVRQVIPFPHSNVTRHGHFSEYFSEAEEALVYKMWKNTFDSGLYQRYEGLPFGQAQGIHDADFSQYGNSRALN